MSDANPNNYGYIEKDPELGGDDKIYGGNENND